MVLEVLNAVPLWLIISIGVVLLLIFMMKSQDALFFVQMFKKYAFYILAIVVVALLVISISSVMDQTEADLKTPDGLRDFGRAYLLWLGEFGSKTARITGNVIEGNFVNVTSNEN